MFGGLWRNVPFEDRRDAGQKLAARLEHLRGKDVVVLALPRGGVPVAYEIARSLGAPLDVLVVRKLGVPGHEELAMGALASGGVRVLNDDVVSMLRITPDDVEHAAAREAREIERRERAYRGERRMEEVRDRTVILVDDGLATGATMRAAVKALRGLRPSRILVAVPVGAPSSCDLIARECDELICLERPAAFYGVGQWYRDFGQTTDEEVRLLLDEARKHRRPEDHADRSAP
jgi:predicted phosphoribosyltransferase